jgi:hypothetical protein
MHFPPEMPLKAAMVSKKMGYQKSRETSLAKDSKHGFLAVLTLSPATNAVKNAPRPSLSKTPGSKGLQYNVLHLPLLDHAIARHHRDLSSSTPFGLALQPRQENRVACDQAGLGVCSVVRRNYGA